MDNNDIIQQSSGMSAETIERLIDLFGIGLFRLNFRTKAIRLTPNTAKLNGYVKTDLPNNEDTKDSLIYEEDRDFVNGSIYSIISGQKDHYHIEYRMRRRDSSIIWVEEVGIISERDEDGNPIFMSSMAMDLSRAKWAEDKARAMELEAKRIVERAGERNLAEENRLLRATNNAAEIIIGGFHQEYDTVLRLALQTLGESIQADGVYIWRNVEQEGQMHCFLRSKWEMNATSLGDANQPPITYASFLPNWQEVLAEGAVLSVNTAYLPQEMVQALGLGSAQSVLLAPLYLHAQFWGLIAFTHREETIFPLAEGEIMRDGAMIVASSISRSETFGMLNTSREKAVASTLAKGEFLSRMSHEMRTPLNAIIGMTEIAKKTDEPQRIQYCMDRVETSSRQLLSIINDVLDMSKIEAGKLEMSIAPFDLNRMIQDAIAVVKGEMDKKGQRFTVRMDGEYSRTLISDPLRLSQIVINLLSNATKFTPEGGNVTLRVLHKQLTEDRINLRVEVQDTGIGITPEQKEKLFKSFVQADGGITRRYGGTGLGLAICKQIINALGGDIWVVSKPDQGACFFFELEVDLGDPLDVYYANNPELENPKHHEDDTLPDIGAQAASGTHHAPAKPIPDWSRHTILLAEDVPINREIVEAVLEETGVKLDCVENGLEAVQKVEAAPGGYALVLMDVQMPVLDGLEATRQIRVLDDARAGALPIIAMTANAFQEDIEMCLSAGMSEHVAKPIEVDAFFRVLEKYLGK